GAADRKQNSQAAKNSVRNDVGRRLKADRLGGSELGNDPQGMIARRQAGYVDPRPTVAVSRRVFVVVVHDGRIDGTDRVHVEARKRHGVPAVQMKIAELQIEHGIASSPPVNDRMSPTG